MNDDLLLVGPWHLHHVPSWGVVGRGYCVDKTRAFCARYGIDYRALMTTGVTASTLVATGDALAIHLVEFARANPQPESK
ncbi:MULTISPECIES: hypothetical protein [Serratia]|uniref:hypothetical protein n=1 Tax=Serratia TaxID=613 RepID=UPI0004688272|nr:MULTISPECIES: hypothetical protein [Serratia]